MDTAQGLAVAAAERLGGAAALGYEVRSDTDIAKAVEVGLPTESLATLGRSGVTAKEITTLIINPRTLAHRRAKGQRLSVDESDRAARVARIVSLAEQTFANQDKAKRWLRLELHALGDRRPIDLIRTQAGAVLVENALARIAWGAPS